MKTTNELPKIDTLLPNQQISYAKSLLNKLNKDSGGMSDKYDYNKERELKGWLEVAVRNKSMVKQLTKKSIIDLIGLQRKLRFMPEHRFYMIFDID